MLLRLQPYDLNVTYKPGKEIPMGDALSRAHLPVAVPDIEPVMVNMINFIAVTPSQYKQFQEYTADELNELHAVTLKGWPDTPHAIKMYWTIRDELSVSDGVVYKCMRIVVPPSMRSNMLAQIYESHLGITKCKQRAREALFWARMTQQIEQIAKMTGSTITRHRPHFHNLMAQPNEWYRLPSGFGVSVRTNTGPCWTTAQRRLKVVICHQPRYA